MAHEAKGITIRVALGNAAFEEGWEAEVARILRDYALALVAGRTANRALLDINGNIVGSVEVKYRERSSRVSAHA